MYRTNAGAGRFGIVIRVVEGPMPALPAPVVVRPGERATVGLSADSTIVVSRLPGRETCRFEVSADGDVTFRWVHHLDEHPPVVDGTRLAGRSPVTIRSGSTIDLEWGGERVMRLAIDEASPPREGEQRGAGVTRVAQRRLGIILDLGKAGERRLDVYADGCVTVEAAGAPIASVMVPSMVLAALMQIANDDTLRGFGSKVGSGDASLTIFATTTFTAFHFRTDEPSPSRWQGLAVAAKAFLPIVELMSLAVAGLPATEFEEWIAKLPKVRVRVPVLTRGEHGRLILRYQHSHAFDRRPSLDQWLELWEDGTREWRKGCDDMDERGELAREEPGNPADAARLGAAVRAANFPLGDGAHHFVFEVYDADGVRDRTVYTCEIEQGSRIPPITRAEEEIIGELAPLFRKA